jgi:hypothetical protein
MKMKGKMAAALPIDVVVCLPKHHDFLKNEFARNDENTGFLGQT